MCAWMDLLRGCGVTKNFQKAFQVCSQTGCPAPLGAVGEEGNQVSPYSTKLKLFKLVSVAVDQRGMGLKKVNWEDGECTVCQLVR